MCIGLTALLPVERSTMQVHHRFDEQSACAEAVNNRVREPMKTELAIVTSNETPPCRFGDNSTQRGFELLEKSFAQTGLPLVIPQGCRLQFLFGLRMADDPH